MLPCYHHRACYHATSTESRAVPAMRIEKSVSNERCPLSPHTITTSAAHYHHTPSHKYFRDHDETGWRMDQEQSTRSIICSSICQNGACAKTSSFHPDSDMEERSRRSLYSRRGYMILAERRHDTRPLLAERRHDTRPLLA